MGYAERVLQPGETITYRARLHWVIYLAGLCFVLIAIAGAAGALTLQDATLRIGLVVIAALALVVGIYQLVRAWIGQASTEIIVTTRRIIYKTGFISRDTVEMNLDKVESILVQQGLIGRALDYGTVIVRGVGAGLEPVSLVNRPLELHRRVSAPGPT